MSVTSIYYGKILHYGKCIIGLAVKHYLVVYPKHGVMLGLMHNFQILKVNKMQIKPYNDWLAIARRYDKSVNFGSPMTAWSANMLKAHKLSNGDIHKAIEILKGLNNAN